MKVRNVISENSGRAVANQFIIKDDEGNTYFQSYDSIIAKRSYPDRTVTLDEDTWDFSMTTGRYRNQFLGETKKETEKKIASGEYKMGNLN